MNYYIINPKMTASGCKAGGVYFLFRIVSPYIHLLSSRGSINAIDEGFFCPGLACLEMERRS